MNEAPRARHGVKILIRILRCATMYDVRCTKYEDAGYDACDVVRAARAVRWAMYDGGGVLRARLRRDRATGRPGAGNRSRARISLPWPSLFQDVRHLSLSFVFKILAFVATR